MYILYLSSFVVQDTFRMSGAKAMRHLFLFEKCVLIAKRREDGNLLTKAHIMVGAKLQYFE